MCDVAEEEVVSGAAMMVDDEVAVVDEKPCAAGAGAGASAAVAKEKEEDEEEDEEDDLVIPDIELGLEEEKRDAAAGKRVGTSLADAVPVEGGFEMHVEGEGGAVHTKFLTIEQAQSRVMSVMLEAMRG